MRLVGGDAEGQRLVRAKSRIKDAGIPFRGGPHGPNDNTVNESGAGRIVYWNEPDGHVWEILTQSYARAPR